RTPRIAPPRSALLDAARSFALQIQLVAVRTLAVRRRPGAEVLALAREEELVVRGAVLLRRGPIRRRTLVGLHEDRVGLALRRRRVHVLDARPTEARGAEGLGGHPELVHHPEIPLGRVGAHLVPLTARARRRLLVAVAAAVHVAVEGGGGGQDVIRIANEHLPVAAGHPSGRVA